MGTTEVCGSQKSHLVSFILASKFQTHSERYWIHSVMSLCVTLAKDNFSSFEGEVNERVILHSFGTTVPKPQFFGAQLSSQSNSHIHT